VIQASQYATPLGWEYAPISEYKEKYRGLITMYKFDREKGRIDMENSFSIEIPPYWQDLCDAGKLVSDGWAFCNSFNTEMATGGIESGQPPFEAGVSQRDTDYLHIFNWKKAAEVAEQAGKTEVHQRHARHPHPDGGRGRHPLPGAGAQKPARRDVTPDGKYMVVAGKLDPHVTIYSFDKIMKAIESKSGQPTSSASRCWTSTP
jgi:nitrous-oxide reductase